MQYKMYFNYLGNKVTDQYGNESSFRIKNIHRSYFIKINIFYCNLGIIIPKINN